MELNAVSLDGEIPGDIDESGIERVPMADPGLDVSGTCYYNLEAPVECFVLARVSPSGG
jgi:hypothetical protein